MVIECEMAGRSLHHITSTPEECCHLERSLFTSSLTEDSGYHSNSSGYVSSTNLNFSNHSNHDVVKDTQRVSPTRQHFPIVSPRLNLTGKKYVDFFYYLGDWFHHTIIVKKILSDLNDEDLYNCALVSKSWRQTINSIPTEEKRLRSYVRKIELTKENRRTNSAEKITNPFENVRYHTSQSPRNRLMQIQNLQESASPPTAKTPAKHSRFEVYQKEALKMKIGRRLFSCPKCKLPSHIDPETQNTAKCTNSTCNYRFCILCECEEHRHKMCDFISTPTARKQNNYIGTAKSKRNLKRLLL